MFICCLSLTVNFKVTIKNDFHHHRLERKNKHVGFSELSQNDISSISQRIHLAEDTSPVNDFDIRNKVLTAKVLSQGCLYKTFSITISNFICQYPKLIVKYKVSLKTFLQEGISEPKFIVI